MKPFLDILYHLSHLTNLKLYPDQNGACKLLIGENIFVQLEPDFSQENLVIASIISEVSVGKFRENVFRHALVANGAEFPSCGHLCFIPKLNALALYSSLPFDGLSAEFLVSYILKFAQKVDLWRNSLQRGIAGPIQIKNSAPSVPPQFRQTR